MKKMIILLLLAAISQKSRANSPLPLIASTSNIVNRVFDSSPAQIKIFTGIDENNNSCTITFVRGPKTDSSRTILEVSITNAQSVTKGIEFIAPNADIPTSEYSHISYIQSTSKKIVVEITELLPDMPVAERFSKYGVVSEKFKEKLILHFDDSDKLSALFLANHIGPLGVVYSASYCKIAPGSAITSN